MCKRRPGGIPFVIYYVVYNNVKWEGGGGYCVSAKACHSHSTAIFTPTEQWFSRFLLSLTAYKNARRDVYSV